MIAPGKRITLDELFRRRREELQKFAESPEGQAQRERNDQAARENIERDRKWAEENPPDPFEDGRSAALANEDREAPDDLDEAAQDRWLEGYDSEAPESPDA